MPDCAFSAWTTGNILIASGRVPNTDNTLHRLMVSSLSASAPGMTNPRLAQSAICPVGARPASSSSRPTMEAAMITAMPTSTCSGTAW